MFCVKCGTTAVAGNFCERCFLEREHLFGISNFRVTRCRICSSFFDNRGMIEIEGAIKNRIVTTHKIKVVRVSYKNRGNHIVADIECKGTIKPFTKTEKKTVDIIVETRQCDDCIKLSGSYYEAVIQIRGSKKGAIFDAIQKAGFLSHVRAVDKGYDAMFVKKHDAAKLAGFLKEYNIKKTYKLVGQKEGKKIYRVYYSIR